jgi:hypothetical protein
MIEFLIIGFILFISTTSPAALPIFSAILYISVSVGIDLQPLKHRSPTDRITDKNFILFLNLSIYLKIIYFSKKLN